MEDEENRKQKEEEEEEQNNPMKVWLLWRFWLNEFKKGGSNKTRHLNPEEWLESNFSLQHHCWIKQYGHESEENDGSLKKTCDCQTNSPCQYHRKCVWSCMENIHIEMMV